MNHLLHLKYILERGFFFCVCVVGESVRQRVQPWREASCVEDNFSGRATTAPYFKWGIYSREADGFPRTYPRVRRAKCGRVVGGLHARVRDAPGGLQDGECLRTRCMLWRMRRAINCFDSVWENASSSGVIKPLSTFSYSILI